MKIGIFGGAFNPIHYGHLRVAEEVRESLCLDKILFIPSGKPPFKKPDLARASHRYKMLKIAIEGNPHFKISNIEMKTPGKSYSVDTVKRLKERYKKSEFFFILGIDAFFELPRWKQPHRLLSLTNFVIISRPGYSFTELSSSPYLKGVSKKILKKLDNGLITEFSFPLSSGRRCILCRVTALNISASGIRNLIKKGKNVKYLLPEPVKSYIISHKLYHKSEK